MFDKIIFEKHGYGPEQKHKTDLNASRLENATFDSNYVLSIRIRTLRNLKGYCLPSFCTRGERRDLEAVIVKSLYSIDEAYKGAYYSLKELSQEEEKTLENVILLNL